MDPAVPSDLAYRRASCDRRPRWAVLVVAFCHAGVGFLKGGEKGAALTEAALKYASALANGYSDPTKLHEVYTIPHANVDVRQGLQQAIQKGEKIYVGPRTIITPSARDIGDPAEVFAKA